MTRGGSEAEQEKTAAFLGRRLEAFGAD